MDVERIHLPDKVDTIIKRIQSNGFEAYAVGGCIRDSILGRNPEDWDITTSALPCQIKEMFDYTIDTGIEHGTVTVMFQKEGFEVTTYRVDGKYEDRRHPKEVTFTRSLKEDLLRRDFTINAMAYNETEGLVDIFGGTDDLKEKVIRCVGEAKKRLTEDALRILRAIRFAAQLDFEIEHETREAIRKLAGNLCNISAERIQSELVKIMVSPKPEMLKEAYMLGITKVIFPEFDEMMRTEQETPHHMYNVGDHTMQAVQNIRADKVLRLTMLFHDTGKPALKTIDEAGIAHFKKHALKSEEITKHVLKRLKFDNDTIRKVSRLVLYHDYRMPAESANVRRAIHKIGEELFPYYLEVRKADVLAQSNWQREEKMEDIRKVEELYTDIKEKKECVSLKNLAVTGKDLIEAGMRPGRQIGETLDFLLQVVLEEPRKNHRETLLSYAAEKAEALNVEKAAPESDEQAAPECNE